MKPILLAVFVSISFSAFAQNSDSLMKSLEGKTGCTALESNPTSKPQIPIRCGAPARPVTEPLLILDGIPLEKEKLAAINPNNIESITVLKASSAQALYGYRAASGVVLITSKTVKDCRVQILDAADSLPVSSATLLVKSEWANLTAISDKEGKVVLPNRLQGKFYRLNLSCIGYLPVEKEIRFDSSHQTLTFYLQRTYQKMDTVVLVSYDSHGFRCRCCGLMVTYTHSHALPQKPRPSPSFAVWPNPVRAGERLTVTPPRNFSGGYQVLSANGQLLQAGKPLLEKEQNFSVLTGNWPAGVYFIRLVDETTGKTTTQKIILQ